jgi:hypothetical protein
MRVVHGVIRQIYYKVASLLSDRPDGEVDLDLEGGVLARYEKL